MATAVIPPTTERGSMIGDGTQVIPWQHFGGGDGLEKVVELQWPNSVAAYRSMMNDAQAQALMFGLILPIRAYRWYLDENGAKPEIVDRISTDYNLPVGIDQTEDFQRRRGQRRFSFEKHMEDAFRALVYGHYFFEQVGEIGTDLKWHLRKLGLRPPRTITEINLSSDGSLKEIIQGYRYPNPIRLPIDRLVAYTWDREGANWVGRSMMRPIYRNFIVKDRVLRVGAINIERAGGVPFIEAPEGASGDQIRELDAMARRFRVGEGAGAALPHGAQLKFASAANGDGAVAYIKQQNEEMARAFCQMVIMLGQTNSGSRALGDVFHDILKVAQYTIAKWFADVFNEHVIEDDVEFNEGPTEEYAPLIKFDAGQQDPMFGFQQALDQAADPNSPTALQVNDPKVRAMLDRAPIDDLQKVLHRRRHQLPAGTPVTAASSSPAGELVGSRSMPREVTYEIIPGTDDLLSTVRNVEICAVGIEYPLSTGPRTFTPDDLLSAVAAQDDPAIKSPRIWLGHPDDQRFHAGRTTPVGSAEPALGTCTDMRIEDEGMTLVTDLSGTPTWIAKIMASAYPNRSVDGYVDAISVSGKRWPLVITDLALLGVQWPGVSNLKDIQALYSVDGPDNVVVEEATPIAAVAASIKISAQAELEKIRRDFVNAVEAGDLPIPGWPWIRVVLNDPNELIVDDDQGGLWAVAYDASGDTVTFSTPVQKKIQYVNASQKRDPTARTLLASMLANGRQVAASWDTRAASRPAIKQGGSAVDSVIIESLRKAHGLTAEQLPDSATEDQIKAAIAEKPPDSPSAPAVTPTSPPATPPGPARPGNDPGGGPPSPDQVPTGPGPGKLETGQLPVAASALPNGMVAVPVAQWEAVQAGAQLAVKTNEENEKAADERILGDAIRAGKVSAAHAASYRNALGEPATRKQYRHLLTAAVKDGGLAPNLVPITAMGGDQPDEAMDQGPAYPPEWLPEVQNREASVANYVTIEA